MTAMRIATDSNNRSQIIHRSPSSSYQTATPQQLEAAGIQPVVLHDKMGLRKYQDPYPSAPLSTFARNSRADLTPSIYKRYQLQGYGAELEYGDTSVRLHTVNVYLR